MKKRFIKPPVLHLPDNKGRFQHFSDTSKTCSGQQVINIKDEN